jgi:hypothetical protein
VARPFQGRENAGLPGRAPFRISIADQHVTRLRWTGTLRGDDSARPTSDRREYHEGVRESWDRRIRRAEQLASEAGPAESLLTFYARLLRRQQDIYDSLKTHGLRSLDRDLAKIGVGRQNLIANPAS